MSIEIGSKWVKDGEVVEVKILSDWQVYLMMTVIVGAMLLGKKMMFFDENKKNKDDK